MEEGSHKSVPFGGFNKVALVPYTGSQLHSGTTKQHDLGRLALLLGGSVLHAG